MSCSKIPYFQPCQITSNYLPWIQRQSLLQDLPNVKTCISDILTLNLQPPIPLSLPSSVLASIDQNLSRYHQRSRNFRKPQYLEDPAKLVPGQQTAQAEKCYKSPCTVPGRLEINPIQSAHKLDEKGSIVSTMEPNDIEAGWIEVPEGTINGIHNMFQPTLDEIAPSPSPSPSPGPSQQLEEPKPENKLLAISPDGNSATGSAVWSAMLGADPANSEPFRQALQEGFDEKMRIWIQEWTKPRKTSLEMYQTLSNQEEKTDTSSPKPATTATLSISSSLSSDTWSSSHNPKIASVEHSQAQKSEKKRPSLTEWKKSHPAQMPFVEAPQQNSLGLGKVMIPEGHNTKRSCLRMPLDSQPDLAGLLMRDYQKNKPRTEQTQGSRPYEMLEILARPVRSGVLAFQETIPEVESPKEGGHDLMQRSHEVAEEIGKTKEIKDGQWSAGSDFPELYYKHPHGKVHSKIMARWDLEKEQANARRKAASDSILLTASDQPLSDGELADTEDFELSEPRYAPFGPHSRTRKCLDLPALSVRVSKEAIARKRGNLPATQSKSASEGELSRNAENLNLRGGGSNDEIYVDAVQEHDMEEKFYSPDAGSECSAEDSSFSREETEKNVGIEQEISSAAIAQKKQNDAWDHFVVPETSKNLQRGQPKWRVDQNKGNFGNLDQDSPSKSLSSIDNQAPSWRLQLSPRKYVPALLTSTSKSKKESKAKSSMEPSTPTRSTWRKEHVTPDHLEAPVPDENGNEWQVVVRSSDRKRGKKAYGQKSTGSPISNKSNSTPSYPPIGRRRRRRSQLFEHHLPFKNATSSSRDQDSYGQGVAPTQALVSKHGYGPSRDKSSGSGEVAAWLATAGGSNVDTASQDNFDMAGPSKGKCREF